MQRASMCKVCVIPPTEAHREHSFYRLTLQRGGGNDAPGSQEAPAAHLQCPGRQRHPVMARAVSTASSVTCSRAQREVGAGGP